ncbi:BRCT-containing protein 1 [Nannizzia gypsea CBS 118893]|uniref:BRCT-containing protein 1 n=1 Tax=Arthroderma gypseum (strain ATCC MYA-4604 / CBS 118893) TaxID=535722 RepID=E4V6F4_ARTGP|nr:BRCT-containing protein 1 [Nannizzia gypsea CBS 118893]EFQ96670.1 BRCT-containing protein 1 [Nannizzia gypsea CBS 118893]
MAEEGLFSQARICIVCSPQMTAEQAEEISSALRENGGEVVINEPQTPLPPVTEFSHIVSPTIDFQGHDAACDALIPVVKPQWVQMSISKQKLANPRQYNPDPRLFMNDVIVTCEDIPEGDKDAIIGGVLAMGGLYTARITSSTTHLVTLTMSEKCTAAKKRGLHTKIVLPHCRFDDCLKLGRRIDERPYLLPNPEILRPEYQKPLRIGQNKDVLGASTPEPNALPDRTSSPGGSRKELDIFKGKTVMISSDLGIGLHMVRSIEERILEGGGEITNEVSKCDIFICRYREGEDYKSASRSGKEVGNLSWLFHLITHNAWTSPLRRLLHYPIARGGIPGFKEFKISLSNYAGEARIYLENLIAAAGAESTKTLKQDNTHLLTAHQNSEKCTAAKEWNLHIVNHLWLEESYAKWQQQSVTDPRYTHFPRRTNLTEVVGQTRIDRYTVEEHFFPPEPAPSVKKPGHRHPPHTKTPKSGDKASIEGGVMPGAELDSTTKTTKKLRGKPLQTPVTPRFADLGKENETPSTTGSRKSKDLAAARLHSLAPDISLFERESKRVGGVIYGGRRKSTGEPDAGRKRSAEPGNASDSENAVDTKRIKTSRPPIAIRLVITGFHRWVEKPNMEDSEISQLRDLGILVITDPLRCTHLAAPSILRTQKFLNALAHAPVIINSDFITDCLDQKQLLDPNDYILEDKASEKKYNFKLEKARRRAEENKQRLLSGHTIYCTDKVKGGLEAFQAIIEANGGQCVPYRGRAGMMISSRRLAADDPDQAGVDDVFLISGPDKSCAKLRSKFRTMARNAKRVPRTVNTDWLLDIALSQEWRGGDAYEYPSEDAS